MTEKTWNSVPLLREEGTFKGTVIRVLPFKTTSGAQIILRLHGEECPAVDEDRIRRAAERMEVRLMKNKTDGAVDVARSIKRILLHDAEKEAELKNSVRIAVYTDGWKYADEEGETDEQDIESLLHLLRPGQTVIFRVSKNWRRDSFYCRYLKIEDLNLWSGYASESDWRQETHTYPYVDLEGDLELTVLKKDFITDDFNRTVLSLEVSRNDDSTFRRFRLIAPGDTMTFRTLSDIPDEEIYKHHYKISITRDKETGKAYAGDIMDLDEPQKKKGKSERKRKNPPPANLYDYKAMREKAQKAEKIPAEELDLTKGFYKAMKAVVRDDGVTDFNCSGFKFLPLTLSDGREICPEIRARIKRSRDAAAIEETIGKPNQLTDKRLMYPGTKVTAYFTPDLKKRYLMLRLLTIDDDAEMLGIRKLEYLRMRLVRAGLLPQSEATVRIERMDEEERLQYEEILKNLEKNLKSEE